MSRTAYQPAFFLDPSLCCQAAAGHLLQEIHFLGYLLWEPLGRVRTLLLFLPSLQTKLNPWAQPASLGECEGSFVAPVVYWQVQHRRKTATMLFLTRNQAPSDSMSSKFFPIVLEESEKQCQEIELQTAGLQSRLMTKRCP